MYSQAELKEILASMNPKQLARVFGDLSHGQWDFNELETMRDSIERTARGLATLIILLVRADVLPEEVVIRVLEESQYGGVSRL
jgi:hypothetical protein